MTDRIIRSLTLTKLHRPNVGRGLVPRPLLLERLNASQTLTLILASAGFGRTTLSSMWLDTCNVPNAWLSLDEHDDDLAVFVTYLAEALHTMFPSVADDTLARVSMAFWHAQTYDGVQRLSRNPRCSDRVALGDSCFHCIFCLTVVSFPQPGQ